MESYDIGEVVWYVSVIGGMANKHKAVVWELLKGKHFDCTLRLDSGTYVLAKYEELSRISYDIENMTQQDVDDLVEEVEELRKALGRD